MPEVLLSGDHARIAAWRHDRSVERTAERRPDLLHPSQDLDGFVVLRVVPSDAGELLTLQLACWVQEQHDNPGVHVPALHESLADVEAWVARDTVLVVRSAERLVAAVRASRAGDEWHIGRLMVAPDLQGRGLGRWLLARIEEEAPPGVTTYTLVTGAGSTRNQRLYKTGRLPPPRPPQPRRARRRPAHQAPPCRRQIRIVPDFGSRHAGRRPERQGLSRISPGGGGSGRLAPRSSRPKDSSARFVRRVCVGHLPQGEPRAAGHHDGTHK